MSGTVEWTAFYKGKPVGVQGDLDTARNEQRDWQREVPDPDEVKLAYRRLTDWAVAEPQDMSGAIVHKRNETQPEPDEHGDEAHPSWGLIGASRGSWGPPGVALFGSEIRHQHAVTIKIQGAVRKRDLHSDRYFSRGPTYVEVVVSEAQWASFVSSMNMGEGVPCTIRHTENAPNVPQAPYAPRLALTMSEARGAADKAFAGVKEALAEYERLVQEKAPAKERKRAFETLEARIRNAGPNVEFAGKVLSEHAENVVMGARADIEAYVIAAARSAGLDPGELGVGLAALPGDDAPREVES